MADEILSLNLEGNGSLGRPSCEWIYLAQNRA